MLINSAVGFISGIVAYADNEVGMFHCQIESRDMVNTLVWSVDETSSRITTGNMYNVKWYYPLANLIAGLDLSTGFAWLSIPPADVKTISDIVLHLTMVATTDDGMTYPISATYERGTLTYHTPSPAATAATMPENLDNLITALTEMIDKAVTACAFIP